MSNFQVISIMNQEPHQTIIMFSNLAKCLLKAYEYSSENLSNVTVVGKTFFIQF